MRKEGKHEKTQPFTEGANPHIKTLHADEEDIDSDGVLIDVLLFAFFTLVIFSLSAIVLVKFILF
jgi:hypothetical protein